MTIHRSLDLGSSDDADLRRLAVRPQLFAPILPPPRHIRYSRRPHDMSTVQTWTLWQRMPPRYQLTTKSLADDSEDLVAIGTSPERASSPRRLSSPRPFSASQNQVPQNTSRPISQRENFMLASTAPPESAPLHQQQENNEPANVNVAQPKGFSFPKRSSDYISTFQKQRRVNSARRRLAEAPPLPNTSANVPQESLAMAQRARTAPVFPVTSPDSHKELMKSKTALKEKENTSTQEPAAVSFKTLQDSKPKSRGEPSRVDMFHFEEAKSVSSSTGSVPKVRDTEAKPKKYVVQDTNKATVFIDNGKVMYFGKSRHDLTQLLKTQSLRADRNNCFLAEIRRDYLKHPKYERGRSNIVQKVDTDPRRIAHERVDYNRRVEHILSYYDEHPPDSRYSPNTRPPSGYRVRSPIGSRFKGLSLTPASAAPSRPPSRSPSPEFAEAVPSDFIRLNRQSKLHQRQFYLRTPGMQHGNITDIEKCRCSMCRMELQLAIVTGIKEDANVAMVAAANDSKRQNGNHRCGLGIGINGQDNVKFTRDINGGRIVLTDTRSGPKPLSRSNSQKVTFDQPPSTAEVTARSNKVHINCKLPEVTDMCVSESGFESSRTQEASSTIAGDVTDQGGDFTEQDT